MKTSSLVSAVILIWAGPVEAASVRNSKHDLSAASATTGPKAVSEKDSCVFCHSSHKAVVNEPLWNRTGGSQPFTFYSSNYLNTYLGMEEPTMSDLAGSKTKLCLSCHDGVTALGAVYHVAPGAIDMTGAMSAAVILGTDLRNDHPVLYDVKPGAGPPTEPGTDPEIRLPAEGDKVRVYGETNRVECTSCHDAHDNEFGDFLVKPNVDATLCTTCHVKTNYPASSHATSNTPYTPEGGSPTTVRERSCLGCHKVHGASSVQAYLLTGAEEGTCYSCHGTPPLPGAKDVQGVYSRAYKHPTLTVAGAHKNPETDASNLGLSSRHAECWDCHNPHQARVGSHTPPGNTVSNSLVGAWGVLPSWASSPWTVATTYVRQVFFDTAGFKEYQLCMKCHSYYAFGDNPPAGVTDQSLEFNPNNRSAHPVRAAANDQTGSVNPRALASAQLSAPWNNEVGGSSMYCSDCHGSDVASDPSGPHGSSGERILKGPRKYWPKNAAGTPWTLNDVKNNSNSWSADLFCVNCHPLTSGGNWENNVHEEHENRLQGSGGVRCINCHSAVPHGAKRSRLIVYESEPAPYNYSGSDTYDRALLKGFKKASGPNNYTDANCYSLATGCHKHKTDKGGYDP